VSHSSLKARVSSQSYPASLRVVPSHLFALEGAGSYSEVCRIHSASRYGWLMTDSRSHLVGPTATKSRISITLFALQHVKRGFRQAPGNPANGLGVRFTCA
jgi:hypothetical protein